MYDNLGENHTIFGIGLLSVALPSQSCVKPGDCTRLSWAKSCACAENRRKTLPKSDILCESCEEMLYYINEPLDSPLVHQYLKSVILELQDAGTFTINIDTCPYLAIETY